MLLFNLQFESHLINPIQLINDKFKKIKYFTYQNKTSQIINYFQNVTTCSDSSFKWQRKKVGAKRRKDQKFTSSTMKRKTALTKKKPSLLCFKRPLLKITFPPYNPPPELIMHLHCSSPLAYLLIYNILSKFLRFPNLLLTTDLH